MECFEDFYYSRFLDGDLSPVQEREILDHLNRCSLCQGLVKQLKGENYWIKKCFQPDHKIPDLTPSVMRKIFQDENGVSRPKIRFLFTRWVLVAAAALFLTVSLFLLFILSSSLHHPVVEQEVLIQNARVEGKPVMTHVFNSRDMDLKFIWLEKI